MSESRLTCLKTRRLSLSYYSRSGTTHERFSPCLPRTKMEKKATIDPEELTPEEREAVLRRATEHTRRRIENEIILRQLEREAQEEERRRESS